MKYEALKLIPGKLSGIIKFQEKVTSFTYFMPCLTIRKLSCNMTTGLDLVNRKDFKRDITLQS